MSLDAAEYAVVKVDEIHDELRRSKSYRALEQGITVIALGTMAYGFCMLYELISDFSGKLAEAVGDVTTGIDVAPEVFSDEGFTVLEEHYKAKGWLQYRLWLRDYENARRVYGVEGTIKALPSAAAKVKEWQDLIVKRSPEIIPVESRIKIHPVDRVVGVVLNNRRTYFGLVGGLALLPAVPAVGSILRSSLKHESS